jgi:hypothetical protein
LACLGASRSLGGHVLSRSHTLSIFSFYETAPAAQPSSDWGSGGAIGNLLILAPFLAFTIVVGALIASRRPENPIGWICLLAGLFWTLIALDDQYTAYTALLRPAWSCSRPLWPR